MKRLAVALLLLLALPACGNVYLTVAPDPALRRLSCPGEGGQVTSTLVLLAQSVPEASLIPCMSSTPPRWRLDDFSARNGSARFDVEFGDEDDLRMTVELAHRCRVEDATETRSDLPGMTRYDHVTADPERYAVDRYYVDAHACTVVHFTGLGQEAQAFADEIVPALGFIPRETLDERLRDATDGRMHLDPEEAA